MPSEERRQISITRDDISAFNVEQVLHCKMCVEECPEGVAPKDWSRLSFGSFRKEGEPGIYLQLWCDRHDCNVMTMHIETEAWAYSDELVLRIKQE